MSEGGIVKTRWLFAISFGCAMLLGLLSGGLRADVWRAYFGNSHSANMEYWPVPADSPVNGHNVNFIPLFAAITPDGTRAVSQLAAALPA